nr:Gfo/Idh/MocA family oxidoreductase [uncultured Cohaesibacter sp.]
MSQAVRIGIAGLGRLGRRHAENLAFRVPGAELVAATSPIKEEQDWATSTFPGLTAYASLGEMLNHPDLDAVWLVTPTSLHAEQTIEVIEAGKHVFCEKPLALETADCDRVIEVAKKHADQLVMVGFMRRFDSAYAEAKRMIDAGELGDIFSIRCSSEDPVDPNGFFIRFAPTSGGIFLDCCIHDIDLVRWMLDGAKVTNVSSAGSRVMYPALADCGDVDNAFATANFETGAVATFHVSRTSHRGYEANMIIAGTKGTVEIGKAIPRQPLTLERDGSRTICGQVDFFERFDEAFLNEARAFVEAVRSGGPTPSSIEDAREATSLACSLRDVLTVS